MFAERQAPAGGRPTSRWPALQGAASEDVPALGRPPGERNRAVGTSQVGGGQQPTRFSRGREMRARRGAVTWLNKLLCFSRGD